MPNGKRSTRAPAVSSDEISQDEWTAYGRGAPLPARLERRRRERLIELLGEFNVAPPLPLPGLVGDALVAGRFDWDGTFATLANRLLSRLVLLPDAKWRRVLHLLRTVSSRGHPAAGGINIAGKGGRKMEPGRAVLLARLDDELRKRPAGVTVKETALRLAGSPEKAISLSNARKWKGNPRRRKGVQSEKG